MNNIIRSQIMIMIIIDIGRSRSVNFESRWKKACWTAVQQGCDGDRLQWGWKHNSVCGGVGRHLVGMYGNSGQRDGARACLSGELERVIV